MAIEVNLVSEQKMGEIVATFYVKLAEEEIKKGINKEMEMAIKENIEELIKKEIKPIIKRELKDIQIAIKERIIGILEK